jgi:hypothetical protein
MISFDVAEPDKWLKCVKLSAVFIAAMFFLGLVIGTLAGVADPDGGWAAWRVGLFVAAIFAAAATLLAFIASAFHIGDM